MNDSRVSFPALSIRQPWADLIILGRKTIEIRSWTTKYRGDIWVHTGKNCDQYLEKAFGYEDLFHGGYIGKVTLERITPFSEFTWNQWRDIHLDYGHFQPGYFAWILTRPYRLRSPILGPGKTLLFKIETGLEELLFQELE